MLCTAECCSFFSLGLVRRIIVWWLIFFGLRKKGAVCDKFFRVNWIFLLSYIRRFRKSLLGRVFDTSWTRVDFVLVLGFIWSAEVLLWIWAFGVARVQTGQWAAVYLLGLDCSRDRFIIVGPIVFCKSFSLNENWCHFMGIIVGYGLN